MALTSWTHPSTASAVASRGVPILRGAIDGGYGERVHPTKASSYCLTVQLARGDREGARATRAKCFQIYTDTPQDPMQVVIGQR